MPEPICTLCEPACPQGGHVITCPNLAREHAALKAENARLRSEVASFTGRLKDAWAARIVGADSFDSRRRRAIEQLISEIDSKAPPS